MRSLNMSLKNCRQKKYCFVLPHNPKRIAEGGLRTKHKIRNLDCTRPIITVITVILNRAKYLDQTIQSVLNQTYDNIEFIIIDGGSRDETLEIIKRYETRIDYWVSEPDTGIYDAMNKGWILANKQSHILFLGAGDKLISLPARIGQMPQKSVIYGNVHLESGKVYYSDINWTLKFHNTLHHQALLVSKLLHPEPPFNSSLKVYGNFDFNQRLLKAGVKFIRCPEFLSYTCAAGVSQKISF